MKLVSSFGLHEDDDGVWWLVQADGGVNAVGLKADCPFKVDRRKCNHQINLNAPAPSPAQWADFMAIRHDPVVDIFLPIPRRTRGIFNCQAVPECLVRLANLSAPIHPVVIPAWKINRKELYDDLQQSNIQPLVVYDVKPEDTQFIREVGRYAGMMPRPFIYHTEAGFTVPATTTEIILGGKYRMPFESIGAEVVRRFMRGEFE